jgi:branched-chain amino acid transport system substrate-binding protein
MISKQKRLTFSRATILLLLLGGGDIACHTRENSDSDKATLNGEECEKNSDCVGGNLVCVQGHCVEKSYTPSNEYELISNECRRVYGLSSNELDGDIVLLGSVLPFSGELSTKGTKMGYAVELAVDEINQAGGILGKKIAVIFCDSGTNSDTTQKALEHLIRLERVPAVIGPASSSVVIETFADVAKEAKILMMSPAATSPKIADLSDDDLLWRTAPSDKIQGAAIANYLLKESTFDKIAIINRDDASGNGIRDAIFKFLCETFPCEDDTRLYKGFYDEEMPEKDQSEIVVELEEFAPSITVLIGSFEDGSAFLELTEDTEIKRFFLTDGMRNNELGDLDMSDTQLCRLVGTQPGSTSSKNYQSFEHRFNAKYGEVGSYSANAYDAIYLISYAIAASNTDDPTGADVARGLRRLSEGDTVNAGSSDWKSATQRLSSDPEATIDYEGASGPLDFDSRGDAAFDIEGWALDLDNHVTVSLGTIYSHDGVYYDLFEEVSGQGEVCEETH